MISLHMMRHGKFARTLMKFPHISVHFHVALHLHVYIIYINIYIYICEAIRICFLHNHICAFQSGPISFNQARLL